VRQDPHDDVALRGKIVAYQKLPDGRFNILVEGRARVRLDELPFEPPYRRARGTLLPEPVGSDAEVSSAARSALLAVTTQVMARSRARQSRFDFDPPLALPTARLALRLVDRFVTDADARQRVIEATTASARVAVAMEVLVTAWTEGATPTAVGSA